MRKHAPSLLARGIRCRFLGVADPRVPRGLARDFDDLTTLTEENRGMTLTVAFDHGGRRDIVQAARRIRNSTSGSGRFQFSVEKAYRLSHSTPEVRAASMMSMTVVSAAWCPAVRGSERRCAQRPLPSMTQATCLGTARAGVPARVFSSRPPPYRRPPGHSPRRRACSRDTVVPHTRPRLVQNGPIGRTALGHSAPSRPHARPNPCPTGVLRAGSLTGRGGP